MLLHTDSLACLASCRIQWSIKYNRVGVSIVSASFFVYPFCLKKHCLFVFVRPLSISTGGCMLCSWALYKWLPFSLIVCHVKRAKQHSELRSATPDKQSEARAFLQVEGKQNRVFCSKQSQQCRSVVVCLRTTPYKSLQTCCGCTNLIWQYRTLL